jgi:hypothetical protein
MENVLMSECVYKNLFANGTDLSGGLGCGSTGDVGLLVGINCAALTSIRVVSCILEAVLNSIAVNVLDDKLFLGGSDLGFGEVGVTNITEVVSLHTVYKLISLVDTLVFSNKSAIFVACGNLAFASLPSIEIGDHILAGCIGKVHTARASVICLHTVRGTGLGLLGNGGDSYMIIGSKCTFISIAGIGISFLTHSASINVNSLVTAVTRAYEILVVLERIIVAKNANISKTAINTNAFAFASSLTT